jgi:peroxiredoxin
MATLTTGREAPVFELVGIDGNKYSLNHTLTHNPILLIFFKVSCPTCQFTLPFVERLYRQIRERGGQIWGISQDNPEESQKFARKFGISFPILVDEKPYLVSRQYGVKFVPTLFLIDKGRAVRVTGDGFSKADLLEIHGVFGTELAFTPAPLFRPEEKIPEYKPG